MRCRCSEPWADLPLIATLTGLVLILAAVTPLGAESLPHVVIVSVDTLRSDRLGGYGYERPTSPNIDRLMAEGVRFAEARTVEPLTSPGLGSLVTSLYPHEHGSTRNGVAMRDGLPSFVKILARRGYRTAAFVGNWTLTDKLSGLGEHFEVYEAVLKRKRWLFWAGEANADDLNQAALGWLERHREQNPTERVALWVHYVEPHGPYHYHEEFADRLGIVGVPGKRDRYDSEVAFVDDRIGRLLEAIDEELDGEPRLTIFTADHGESLGEHGYWGHGRNCHAPGLRIPLSFSWPGEIAPATVRAPALITDVATTVLGLLGLPSQESFHGYDWSALLRGVAEPPPAGPSFFQAHKGAVRGGEAEKVRQRGLLEVARVEGDRKEIVRVRSGDRWVYDLERDPGETESLVPERSPMSPQLRDWRKVVQAGLALSDVLPPPSLTPDEIEQLRALGYLD
ncbi:MAG: sulfatase [Thermoanaerobaculia bacterium]|nr:sulfatase [Thermoanaerobaculia bacterium]